MRNVLYNNPDALSRSMNMWYFKRKSFNRLNLHFCNETWNIYLQEKMNCNSMFDLMDDLREIVMHFQYSNLIKRVYIPNIIHFSCALVYCLKIYMTPKQENFKNLQNSFFPWCKEIYNRFTSKNRNKVYKLSSIVYKSLQLE